MVAAVLVLFHVPSVRAGQIASDIQVASESRRLFAASSDRRHVMTRGIAKGENWEPLDARLLFDSIAGLAVANDALYIVDEGSRQITRRSLTSGYVTHMAVPSTVGRPGDLATLTDESHVYVLDAASHDVFRVGSDGAQAMGLSGVLATIGTVRMSSDGVRRLIFSLADERRILTVETDPVVAHPTRIIETYGTARSSERTATARAQGAYPVIRAPGAMTVRGGLVYVMDSAAKRPFLMELEPPEEGPRPIPLSRWDNYGDLSAVLALEDALVVLREGGAIDVASVFVAAEVSFPSDIDVDPMPAIYRYLQERRMLPSKQVSIVRSIQQTLIENGVLFNSAAGEIKSVLCGLNRGLCVKGDFRTVHAGEPLTVPDLIQVQYAETIFRSAHSTSSAAWQECTSGTPESRATCEALKPTNARAASGVIQPVTYVRCVFPARSTDLPAGDAVMPAAAIELTKLDKAMGRLFRQRTFADDKSAVVPSIRSLEQRQASVPQAIRADGGPYDSEQEEVARLRTLVKFPATAPQLNNIPTIGIVEQTIDFTHPALRIGKRSVFQNGGDSLLPTAPENGIRDATLNDHGTMVSWLLAGQASPFGHTGLFPSGRYRFIESEGTLVAERIREAVGAGATIFNISQDYPMKSGDPVAPPNLIYRIKNRGLLFVVAAGDLADVTVASGKLGPICNATPRFPECWAAEPNVIVVTATDKGGITVLPPVLAPPPPLKGAAWDPVRVHLAVPADGTLSACNGGSYARGKGTSFAAPVVTSAAAYLAALGYDQPVRIKRRLIATADVVPSLVGSVQGGRLNVERALASPDKVVLHWRDAAPEEVDVKPDSTITLKRTDAGVPTSIVIRMDRILRAHPYGKQYRVVYVEGASENAPIRVLDDVEIADDQGGRFRILDGQNDEREVDLADLEDYVGSIKNPIHAEDPKEEQ